jgi:hypothetical protein
VLAVCSHAGASIVGVTGATTWLGSPPAACGPFQLFSANAFAWDEQQNIPLTVACDMINNPGNSGSPTPGVISGLFDSHFIHFDGSTGVTNAIGTVTFSGPIIGVIFSPNTLTSTDPLAGALGTVYPTGYPLRGLFTSTPSFCSINANTISFNLNAFPTVGEIAQIRVLTHPTPAPGSLAVLAAAGMVCARRRRSEVP